MARFTITKNKAADLQIEVDGEFYPVIAIVLEAERENFPYLRLLVRSKVGTVVELRGQIDPDFVLTGNLDDVYPLDHPIQIEILDVFDKSS